MMEPREESEYHNFFQEAIPLATVSSRLEKGRAEEGLPPRRTSVPSFYAAAMQVQRRNNTLRVFETRPQSASARNLTGRGRLFRRSSSEATEDSDASTASSSGSASWRPR